MLEELTAYKTFGSAIHLAKIARSIECAPCTYADLFSIVNSNSSVDIPRIEASVSLLQELGFCSLIDNQIRGTVSLTKLVNETLLIGSAIGLALLRRMLDECLIPAAKIQYDLETGCGYLPQHEIPLRYSQMRNYLIDAGILEVKNGSILFMQIASSVLQDKVSTLENGLTPEELTRKLERNREAGAAAEAFAIEYEKRRLGPPLSESIRQVSLISVSAGYDIASFESDGSTHFDKFIEVKAIGRDGFYLSSNELRVAKKLGRQYYLYLIDLGKTSAAGYQPEIIQHPSEYFAEASDWRVVPDGFHITRVE